MSSDTHLLRLYFFPSPLGIDWSSPRSLLISTLKNQIAVQTKRIPQPAHPIGHVNIELISPLGNFVTGMVNARDPNELSDKELILKKGLGLGILFQRFKGRMETADDLKPQLAWRHKNGLLSILEIKLSEVSAKKILAYHQEYQHHLEGIQYGFPCNTLAFEGGGCSQYAASFLEVGGILTQEFQKHWTYEVRVPTDLIGVLKTTKSEARKKVSLLKILKRNHWAHLSNESSVTLKFWDPDRMHHWLLQQHPLNSETKAPLHQLDFRSVL